MKKKVLIILVIIILSTSIISISFIVIKDTDDNAYNEEIYHKLSIPVGNGNYPSYSPDGKNILFISVSDYSNEIPAIWVMDPDGTNHTMLYANSSIDSYFTAPKFSPDGDNILFCSAFYNSDTKLHGASIDLLIRNGSYWDNTLIHKQIYIVHNTESQGSPMETVYCPYGEKIAYRIYAGPDKYGDIWIMDINGTNNTRLTTNPGSDGFPNFSPDGSKIVYVSRRSAEEPTSIWLMNSDGSNEKKIASGDWYNDQPSFTPDGRIIFISERTSPKSNRIEPGNIWMMNDDGSNQILIVPTKFGGYVFNTQPSISPDGTKIIFSHGLGDPHKGFYYVEDPTGEWKDSDGDGVWDGIDGAPNDPDEGYIKDGLFDEGGCRSIWVVSTVMMVAVFGRWKMKAD